MVPEMCWVSDVSLASGISVLRLFVCFSGVHHLDVGLRRGELHIFTPGSDIFAAGRMLVGLARTSIIETELVDVAAKIF